MQFGRCLVLTIFILLSLEIILPIQAAQPVPFEYSILDDAQYGHREMGDIDGNGLADIIAVNHQEGQTTIVWYEYPEWNKYTISGNFSLNDYPSYSADDMKLGDLDGDGDLDVVGRMGKTEEDQEGIVCWFENPLPNDDPEMNKWKRHQIGECEYVTELDLSDFNGDGQIDVVSRTPKNLLYWLHKKNDTWGKITVSISPKEGMNVADMDRDGDPDVVVGGYWVETPTDLLKGKWEKHIFSAKWIPSNGTDSQDSCCEVETADMNRDGCLDILVSQSEKPGFPIAWYEAPSNPKSEDWKEHIIGHIDSCHSLKVADFDLDGDLDVVVAKIPRDDAPHPVVLFLNQGDSLTWHAQLLSETGNYNIQIGDLQNDGDMDIIGVRNGDRAPIELWENRSSDKKLSLDTWTYILVDEKRGKWGDWAQPDWVKYFGLAMGDITGDGFKDIVSGRYFYRNPGGGMTGRWPRVDLGLNVDAILIMDVDGDRLGDVIAQALPDLYWFEASHAQGNSWTAQKIGEVLPTDHINSQGFVQAQIIPGGKPEFLIASGEGIFSFEIPDHPEQDVWRKTQITKGTCSEGIGVGDVDRDGNLDIATASQKQDYFAWWKNPGDGSANWTCFKIGSTPHDGDRFALVELNGDGKVDLVITEERAPGDEPDANLWWYEQPPDPATPWIKHLLITEYSLNNLGVADMDRDGDIDIVTCEHKGIADQLKLQIWENDGLGNFTEHLLGQGIESHLGTQLADLDGDEDIDIVSIAWDRYQYLHVWRNDAIQRGKSKR